MAGSRQANEQAGRPIPLDGTAASAVEQAAAQAAAQAVPPPDPALISTFETGRLYRVHHSYIWLMPLNVVATLVVVLGASAVQNAAETAARFARLSDTAGQALPVVLVALLGLAAIYGLVAALHAWSWRHMGYRFDAREFSFFSGIFSKKRVHVPYVRVQSVNHRAGIMQRIFGVCTVTVDTAGGAANKQVRIPYVGLGTFERIRAELFCRKAAVQAGCEDRLTYHAPAGQDARKQAGAPQRPTADHAPVPPTTSAPVPPGTSARPASSSNVLDEAAAPVIDWRGAFGGATPTAEQPAFRYGLTNAELVLASVSHTSTVGALVAFVIAAVELIALFGGMGALFLPAVLTVAALGWAAGVARVMLTYGGFTAQRTGTHIQVEYGVLRRRSSGIDVARVQSVVVRQSFVRRLLGYCEVSLGRVDATDSDGAGDADQLNPGGLLVHPFVKTDRVQELVDGLLPEFADRPQETDRVPLPRVALRRGLLRRCLWMNPASYGAVCLVVLAVLWQRWGQTVLAGMFSASRIDLVVQSVAQAIAVGLVVCAVALVVSAVGTVLWQRESGFFLNRRFAGICNGGLSTEWVLVPRTKVQFAYARTNPLQRSAGTASVYLVTAAGVGHTRTRLIDVAADSADAWLLWTQPRGEAPSREPGL